MRVKDMRLAATDGMQELSAEVVWEDTPRPPLRVFFRVASDQAAHLTENPHAFLIGAAIPAYCRGEQRLKIDAEVCPRLLDGLQDNLTHFGLWEKLSRPPLVIETRGKLTPTTRRPPCAAGLLSGGVDSLHQFCANRKQYPRNHPASFQVGLFIYGADIGWNEADVQAKAYDRARNTIETAIADLGVEMVIVHTNVRHIDSDINLWMHCFHGAALAASVHAASGMITEAHIAASLDARFLAPWGSHPLLDPNYSSEDCRIAHGRVRFGRLEKIRLLTEWPVVLNNIRVCTRAMESALNCGVCEKCVRTRLELLALGRLDQCAAFPPGDITAEMVNRFHISKYTVTMYREIIPLLEAQGRTDLTAAIQRRISRCHLKEWSIDNVPNLRKAAKRALALFRPKRPQTEA